MIGLKIAVCIKRVPETGGRLELTDDRMAVDTSNMDFVINTHDESAVEAAIQIKEAAGEGEAHITILSLGPPETTEVIRQAIAMGADAGVLLECEEGDQDWDAHAIANALVNVLKDREVDLYLLGREAGDDNHYQVGPIIAERLDLPLVTGVSHLEVADGVAAVRRETEVGDEVYEIQLPAVLTVNDTMTTPRHASLRGIMRAKRTELEVFKPERGEPKLQLIGLKKPPEREGGEIIGEGPEAVPELVTRLKQDGVL